MHLPSDQRRRYRHYLIAVASAAVILLPAFVEAEIPLGTLHESASTSTARLKVLADQPAVFDIPASITGKFEHRGANIYRGMDVQVLAKPSPKPQRRAFRNCRTGVRR